MKLSAVVITKNEEENIQECLELLDFADEQIVIDDKSTDKTRVIAEEFGARIFKHDLNDNYAGQRNFGLSNAKGKWVIFIDADERVDKVLANEIKGVVSGKGEYSGYRIKREDVLWGRRIKYGEPGYTWLVRLGLREKGSWRRKVHEVWEIEGEVGKLNNSIKHYPHNDLSKFVNSINQYSSIHAKENMREGKVSGIFKIMFYPPLKFIDNIIIKLGILDGVYGFVIAFMMSFHSFLSWSKLWLYQRKD